MPVPGPATGNFDCSAPNAVQEDRTELMVMVAPYVIADHEGGVHPGRSGDGSVRTCDSRRDAHWWGYPWPGNRVLAPTGRRSYGVTASNCWVCPCVRGGAGPPAMLVSGSWGASSALIQPDRSRATNPDSLSLPTPDEPLDKQHIDIARKARLYWEL